MEETSTTEHKHIKSSSSFKFSNKKEALNSDERKCRTKTQKPDGSNTDSSFSDNDNRKSENLSPMK